MSTITRYALVCGLLVIAGAIAEIDGNSIIVDSSKYGVVTLSIF
jgi:hypothetical protein